MTPLRTLAGAIDACAGRYSHFTVENGTGSGFALFGGSKARHVFERLYLGAHAPLPRRLVVHAGFAAERYREMARRYGLVVFCGESAPAELQSELLTVPVMIDMEMPLPAPIEGPGARWSQSVKNNLRRIRMGRFEHDVQPADQYLEEFYTRMHRPSMLRRHGDEAYVTPLRELRRLLLREPGLEIVRVLQDGRWVAGNLNQSSDEGYRLWRLGWLDGDAGLLRQGAVSASYWFNIRRAAALGHAHIYFGSVMPYLDDGVLQYKAFWGAYLSPAGRPWGAFRLLLHADHPDCRRFLSSHSLVTHRRDGGYIVFSGTDPESAAVTPTMLTGIARWYRWREQPLSAPETTDPDVPVPLRPWLDPLPMPS